MWNRFVPLSLARRWGQWAPVAIVAILAVAALAQTPPASGTAAFQHIVALSQQIGPRPAGSSADLRAADYIADQLRVLGYTVERQSFPVQVFDEVHPPTLTVVVPEQTVLRPVTCEFSASTPGDGLEGEIVAAGLGRDEDLRGRRLDGKVALMERGEIFFRVKVANAAAAGASAAIIYNNRPGPAQVGTLLEPAPIPAVMISQGEGQRLAQWLRVGPVRVRLVVSARITQRTTQNVIGIKLGTGTPREAVVVGAHADSVDDSPGANDNASGVAAMLEVARLLARTPTARTVHFVAFGAEEIGLHGSRAYAHTRPGTVVGMVNLDMVGRGPGILVGNGGGDRSLVDLAQRVARRLGLQVTPFRLGSSDHVSFEQAGIPAVFLHTGDDDAQHTSRDTADRVNPQLLEQVASLAAGIVLDVATPPR